MAIMRTCLDCRSLSANGSRCQTCTGRREAGRAAGRAHYRGDYRKRAAEVRATATICWLCGDGVRVDDPWTADHVDPGNPDSILLAAHRSCNSARGDAKGRRAEQYQSMEKR
jgi:hypothetical protein